MRNNLYLGYTPTPVDRILEWSRGQNCPDLRLFAAAVDLLLQILGVFHNLAVAVDSAVAAAAVVAAGDAVVVDVYEELCRGCG